MRGVGSGFLESLVSDRRPRIAARCVLVIAHPDDEALASGALIPRLPDLVIVHVTDGAVHDDAHARRNGYPAYTAYAAQRRGELARAMALAGVPSSALIGLGIADQGVGFALVDIVTRLVPLIRNAEVVLTHAYEGGHPDHDATAFAVQAAVALIAPAAARPTRIEMPLYRAGRDAGVWLRQTFAGENEPSVLLRLNDAERTDKAKLLAAYTSQREVLQDFGTADEPYRVAPVHDFTRPPNQGRILYERYDWGMSFARFAELARSALQQLGQSEELV